MERHENGRPLNDRLSSIPLVKMSSAYKALVDWIQSNGGYVSPLVTLAEDLNPEDGARGIVCLQDLPIDYEFLRLPSSLILNPTTSAQFQKHLKGFFKKNKVSDWSPLMWSIILERREGASSFQKPYFDSVPQKINLPCEWPTEDQKYLRRAAIYNHMQMDFSDQDFAFKSIAKRAKLEIPNIIEEYRAAGSLVSAYSFCDGKLVCMVPFADLLNHKTGCNNARLFFEDSLLSMRCIRDCAKGEQLYNTYGELGNTDLLLKYGFICRGNTLDDFTVSLEDPLLRKFLKKKGIKRNERLDKFPTTFIPVSTKSIEKLGKSLFKLIFKFEISRHKPIHPPQNENQRLAFDYLNEYRRTLTKKVKRLLVRYK